MCVCVCVCVAGWVGGWWGWIHIWDDFCSESAAAACDRAGWLANLWSPRELVPRRSAQARSSPRTVANSPPSFGVSQARPLRMLGCAQRGRMLGYAALACLAATASALTPASVLRSSPASPLSAPTGSRAPAASRAPLSSRVQRSRTLVAQYSQQDNLPAGWNSGFDQGSQSTYYVNEVTGVSQWEPPDAAAYWDSSKGPQAAAVQAAQVVWRVVPTTGVCNVVFNVGNGQQQVLGRSHMADDHPGDPTYVSRQQCIVEVADDGTASLISIGKPLTLHKPPSVDFWCGLKKTKPLGDDIGYDSAHVLTDGEQISLDMREPDAAVFTIVRKEEQGADTGGGYDAQYYSDDGNWRWNGSEWVPAR